MLKFPVVLVAYKTNDKAICMSYANFLAQLCAQNSLVVTLRTLASLNIGKIMESEKCVFRLLGPEDPAYFFVKEVFGRGWVEYH